MPDDNNQQGGQQSTVDLAALTAQLLPELMKGLAPEINKAVNGATKGLKTDLLKLIPQPAQQDDAAAAAAAATTATTDGKAIDPAVNAELARLRREHDQAMKKVNEALDTSKKERDARLEMERTTAIRNVLNELPFRDQASRDLFFKAVKDDIKRTEDGELIADSANGPLPLKDYLTQTAESTGSSLLAPKTTGGAGASVGGKKGPAGRTWTHGDLTPENIGKLSSSELAELSKMALDGQIK